MRFLMAAVAVMPFALLLVGMLTGRAKVRSCCAVDVTRGLRMPDAAKHAPAVAEGSPSATGH